MTKTSSAGNNSSNGKKSSSPTSKTTTTTARNKKKSTAKARTSMEKFKMEAANEVGVNLKESDNGHLTARQAGSIGGQMVKKMIESYKKKLK